MNLATYVARLQAKTQNQEGYAALRQQNSEQLAAANNSRLDKQLNNANSRRWQGQYQGYDGDSQTHRYQTPDRSVLPARSTTNGALGLKAPVSVFRAAGSVPIINSMPR